MNNQSYFISNKESRALIYQLNKARDEHYARAKEDSNYFYILDDIVKKEVKNYFDENSLDTISFGDLIGLGTFVIESYGCWSYHSWRTKMMELIGKYFQYKEHLESVLLDIWSNRNTIVYSGYGYKYIKPGSKSISVLAHHAYANSPRWAKIVGHKYLYNTIIFPIFLIIGMLFLLCFGTNENTGEGLVIIPLALSLWLGWKILSYTIQKSKILIVLPWIFVLFSLILVLCLHLDYPTINSFDINKTFIPLILGYAIFCSVYTYFIHRWGFDCIPGYLTI